MEISEELHSNISAIILAAGFSERFGYPKAFLRFNESQTFLDRLVEQYQHAGIERILLVINEQSLVFAEAEHIKLPDGIRIVINKHPEYERFYSILLGVKSLINSEYCFVQNVDSPFVTAEMINAMVKGKGNGDYVVPAYKGRRGHPVLIDRKVIAYIRSLSDYNSILRDVLHGFNRGEVEMKDDSFLRNINTVEEFGKLWVKVLKG